MSKSDRTTTPRLHVSSASPSDEAPANNQAVTHSIAASASKTESALTHVLSNPDALVRAVLTNHAQVVAPPGAARGDAAHWARAWIESRPHPDGANRETFHRAG